MEAVEKLIRDIPLGNNTIFIVDETEGEKTLKYFKNSAKFLLMDAELLTMKMTTKRQPLEVILEECRFQLTFAMKYGKVLVLRFGNSMTDFKNTFCDECCPTRPLTDKANPTQPISFLPKGFMLHSGEHLKAEHIVRCLYRRDDIVEMLEEEDEDTDFEDIIPTCHPDFKVILTTSMPHEKLDDFHFHAKYGLPEQRSQFRVVRFSMEGEQGVVVDDDDASGSVARV